MKRSSYAVPGAAAVVMAAAFLFAASGRAKQPPMQKKERQAETGGPSASLLSAKTVRLTRAAQARVGIRVAALKAAEARKRISAPAVVLSAESLAASRQAYIAAQGTLEKDRVKLAVARAEYERVRKLYRDNQNVSRKAFESARGLFRSDRIDVHSAQLQLHLQEGLVRQRWGPVLARWVAKDSPALGGVLQQNTFLVQVSLPPGESYPAPATAWLGLPGAKQERARYVSQLPRVDPRVQGVSLLYLAGAREGLAPGVTLVADLPVGRRMRGVVVPASAVVWSEGKAWIYLRPAATRFVRHVLNAAFRFGGGFFVSQGIPPGAKIVVAGAQTLLSAELSPKGSSKPEGDHD